MPLTQTRFLGASLVSYSVNLGWSANPSQLTVSLVEDDKQNDRFTSPNVGNVAYFIHDNFSYGGIIISWNKRRDREGDPTYEVVLQDPRELLDGVQLIIQGYTGGIFNVPNVYNIFGYWESLGFGRAGVNESGIEWHLIRDGFLELQKTTKVRLKGYSYTINLDNLPSLPNYYRIGGSSESHVSLMSFISEICDAASHDFFFRLMNIAGENVLKLYTVNRSNQPNLGLISNFIQSQTELIRGDSGLELRNETTNKFLVGGNKIDVYFTWQSGSYLLPASGGLPYAERTIWPFWGTDLAGNAIIGQGLIDNEHRFTLESIKVDVVGVGDTYETNIQELRAALHSRESWEKVILGDYWNVNSPHYAKALKTGMLSDMVSWRFVSGLSLIELGALTPANFAALTGRQIRDHTNSIQTLHEQNIERLYNAVHSFAAEYYGKKFMARIPSLGVKRDEFTNLLITSVEPTDAGFLPEQLYSGAVAVNLMPEYTNLVTLEDGRVRGYVKFDNYKNLDYADLSPEDYFISKNSLFVRATLEDRVFFADISGLTNPRVVATIPSPVYKKVTEDDSRNFRQSFWRSLSAVLIEAKKFPAGPAGDQARANLINALYCRMGGEFLFQGELGLMVLPDMIASPLKSNVDFYGPWYSVGAVGKTEFEQEDSLVPWNFGGYATMNLAAQARVTSALSNMQTGEGGSIEIAGTPNVLIGGELIAGGPLVTDISVSISPQGATTTYRMQTWTPRFGKVSKQFADRAQKLAVKGVKQRHLNQDIQRFNNQKFLHKREFAFPIALKRKTASSSMQFMGGEYIPVSGNTGAVHVVFAPPVNIPAALGSGYERKTLATLDTLFFPFSTDPSSTTLPHFDKLTDTSTIQASSLNPYGRNLFNVVSRGDELNDDLITASGFYKGIGLRTPLIMGGWGYDINGNPVPNSGIGTERFLERYAERPLDWKVGPLDVRWEDSIKCWKATGGGMNHGYLITNVGWKGSGLVQVYHMTSSGEHYAGNTVWARDWMLASGEALIAVPNGLKVIIGDDNLGGKYILEARCV